MAIGPDAMLGLFCGPASPGPRLTGGEFEVAGLVAGADQSGHRQAPVCGAADRRGACGEPPAQAAGRLPHL